MNNYYHLPGFLADTYGSGNFGGCPYATGCTSTTGSSSGLVNTGTAAIVITSVAVLILILAFVVSMRRKGRGKGGGPKTPPTTPAAQ